MKPQQHIRRIFERSIETKRAALDKCQPAMVRIADLLAKSLHGSAKILFCGNACVPMSPVANLSTGPLDILEDTFLSRSYYL